MEASAIWLLLAIIAVTGSLSESSLRAPFSPDS
jgi:hypothetical protein